MPVPRDFSDGFPDYARRHENISVFRLQKKAGDIYIVDEWVARTEEVYFKLEKTKLSSIAKRSGYTSQTLKSPGFCSLSPVGLMDHNTPTENC